MRLWKYIYIILLLTLSVIIISVFQLPDGNLHIVACDVGQGDAILITYKDIQILTDGGPDSSVLNCLGRHMPFWDREIELIVSTHPDSDHSTGLTYVLERYKVDKILINPIDSGTDIYRLLRNEVGSQGVGVVNPKEGMSLRLGLIYLDIVSPSDELLNRLTVENVDSNLAKYVGAKETNLYSIVYKLSFKNFSGLFLGDISPEVSDSLSSESAVEGVNYIKIPHHGSANGLTQNLLEKVVSKGGSPTIGVISVSAKNQWGFPVPAILQMLAKYDVKVYRTDQMGDVEVVTDGEKYWVK